MFTGFSYILERLNFCIILNRGLEHVGVFFLSLNFLIVSRANNIWYLKKKKKSFYSFRISELVFIQRTGEASTGNDQRDSTTTV